MKVYQSKMIATKIKEEIILLQEIVGEESIRKKKEERFNLKSRARTLKEEIFSVYTDKKKLVTVMLLSTIWVYIFLSKNMDNYGFQIRLIEYLFVGRIGEGVLDIVGSFFSKIIFSYFIVSTLIPIAIGDYKVKTWKKELNVFREVNYRNEKNIIYILMGIGLALVVSNFLSGKLILENSMISIVVLILLFKSYISEESSFKLLLSEVALILKKRFKLRFIVERIMIGIMYGFVLSMVLSFFNIYYTGYFLGALIGLGLIIYYLLEYRELRR